MSSPQSELQAKDAVVAAARKAIERDWMAQQQPVREALAALDRAENPEPIDLLRQLLDADDQVASAYDSGSLNTAQDHRLQVMKCIRRVVRAHAV